MGFIPMSISSTTTVLISLSVLKCCYSDPHNFAPPRTHGVIMYSKKTVEHHDTDIVTNTIITKITATSRHHQHQQREQHQQDNRHHRCQQQLLYRGGDDDCTGPVALEGSWVVISRAISRITIPTTNIRGLIRLLSNYL